MLLVISATTALVNIQEGGIAARVVVHRTERLHRLRLLRIALLINVNIVALIVVSRHLLDDYLLILRRWSICYALTSRSDQDQLLLLPGLLCHRLCSGRIGALSFSVVIQSA